MNPLIVRESQEDADQGNITMLVIGLSVLSLLIASAVIGITSVYLEYKKLQDLADQTALSVAHEVRGLEQAQGPSVRLNDQTIQQYSVDFVQESSTSFKDLSLGSPTGILEDDTAQVTLNATASIPFLSSVVPVSVPISATGVAQTVLNR